MHHFIFKYSWLLNIAASLFAAGMIWMGALDTKQSTAQNVTDISILKTDVAEIKGEVHGIFVAMGGKP